LNVATVLAQAVFANRRTTMNSNTDSLLLINKHLELLVSAEVQRQLVDYKTDNVIDQDTTLTSAQKSEVDTMIRDIINNELTISADHI